MTQGFSVRCLLLVTIVMLGLHRDVQAQCVVFKVVVDGDARSESKDTQVLVRVHANRGNLSLERDFTWDEKLAEWRIKVPVGLSWQIPISSRAVLIGSDADV
jgi:hypothetical protein